MGPTKTTSGHFEDLRLADQKVLCNCNLCGHLQRCQMPDIENSRKAAEKGAEWVTVKQPEKQPKHPKTAVLTVFRVFRLFFRLFFGCLQ